MALGLASKLNVMQTSPYESGCASAKAVETENVERWVPSRYNIRAKSDEGHLILWNTLSGAMNVFPPDQAPRILELLAHTGQEGEKEGTLEYLVDRGFLISTGVDEYKTFQYRFNRQQHRTDILQLMMMSSEDCNFRCKYCYEDFARGTMKPEVREGIKRHVENRVDHLTTLVTSWFGGEPLYGWEAVEDLGPFLHEIAEENDLGFSGHMTTNGYLLTPDIQEKLLAWRVRGFQITIDGSPEDHDKSRPGRDGSSTFWQIFDNLCALSQREEDFRVRLRVNVDMDNHGRVPEFLDLVEERLGQDPRFAIAFHAVSKWGGKNDDNLPVCGADEDSVLTTLKAAAIKKGITIANASIAGKLGQQVCYAGRPYQYLIGADGQIMKCTIALDKDPRNIVGQVTEDGEFHLDNAKVAAWTEPVYERDASCKKCVLLPNCGGLHCPLPRIEEDRKSCVPERSAPKARLVEMFRNREGRQVEITA